jgi:outer membrane protein assembly factor BamB
MKLTIAAARGVIAAVGLTGLALSSHAGVPPAHLLDLADAHAGICVMPQCGDGANAMAVAASNTMLVLALDERPAMVAVARAAVGAAGLLNTRVYVAQASATNIPLANHYADALLLADVTDESLANYAVAELVRVVSPGCRAAVGGADASAGALWAWLSAAAPANAAWYVTNTAHGTFAVLTKALLAGADDWAYWYHAPDINPVSSDTALKAPYLSQFYAEPFHGASPNCTVAAGGRVFRSAGTARSDYDYWEAAPDYTTIFAHNGYNGQELWRYVRKAAPTEKYGYIATRDTYYLIESNAVVLLDARRGTVKDAFVFTNSYAFPKWIALFSNTIVMVKGAEDLPRIAVGVNKYEYDPWTDAETPWGYGHELVAYDLATKAECWRRTEAGRIFARNVALCGTRLIFHVPSTNANTDTSRVACLDAATGGLLWQNTNAQVLGWLAAHDLFGHQLREPRMGMLCTSSNVFLWRTGASNFVALSALDGALLWKTNCTGNIHAFFREGFLYAKGLKFNNSVLAKINPATGAKLRQLTYDSIGCARVSSSPDGLYTAGGRGADANGTIGMDGAMGFKSGCNEGTIPANGLLYATPTVCKCNISARGFVAAGYAGDGFNFSPVAGPDRLETGGTTPAGTVAVNEFDWPVYRKNNEHAAATPVAMGSTVSLVWVHQPLTSNMPTAIVTADGRAYVGGSDGQVRCISTADGAALWSFATEGRIMAAPTIWSNRVYVGSGDGCVYALDAVNGALLWKYRLAPASRRIMIYDYLSSTWPVNSGVLIHNGIAYAVAGMMDWDQLHVFALNAETGARIWQNSSSAFVGGASHKGAGGFGFLTVLNGTLWLASGPYSSPTGYDLLTGAVHAAPFDFKATLRGREIGVYGTNMLVFGGKMLYGRPNEWAGIKGEHVNYLALTPAGARDGNQVSNGDTPVLMPAWDNDLTIADDSGAQRTFAIATAQHVSRLMATRNNAMVKVDDTPAARLYETTTNFAGVLWQKGSQRKWGTALAADAAVILYGNAPSRYNWVSTGFWLSVHHRLTGAELCRRWLPGEPMIGGLAIDRNGTVLVPLADGRIAAYRGSGVAIQSTPSQVQVLEGGTNSVQLMLGGKPETDVTVSVSRVSGDADIFVAGPAAFPFSTSDWAGVRTIVLGASNDTDGVVGTAVMRCAAPGCIAKDITVTELELAPQHPSITINNSALTTFATQVTLTLHADTPTPAAMQISEAADFAGAPWLAYATSQNFTLQTGERLHIVYARFSDGGINISETASASIMMVPEPALWCGLVCAWLASSRRSHNLYLIAIPPI